MQLDIQKFINNCELCQNSKYERNPYKIPDQLTPNPKHPFDIVHIDILTLNKEKYLTMIDAFTKFAICKSLKHTTSINIVEKLIKIFSLYLVPNQIVSDNGVEFKNELLKNFLNGYNIKLHITSTANPQSNGLIERFHSTLIEHLRIIEQRKEFNNLPTKKKICLALVAYNNSLNSTKYSPTETLFGNETGNKITNFDNVEHDYLNIWKENLQQIREKVQERNKINKLKRFLKQNETKDQNIEIQDKDIMVKENPRLLTKFKKPLYKKQQVVSVNKKRNTIKITDGRKFKINKLKRKRLFVSGTPAGGQK